MSHVVVAPDKFKGTLTAAEVAAHVATGLGRARPGLRIVQVPVADGGDGTVDAAEAAGYRRVELGVRGPTSAPVTASFALLDGTAIIESAQACGLTRLPGGIPAPLTATSRGVGELILAAVRMRANRMVLGLGGVACTDGGAGLVTALGGRLVDSSGTELPPGGAALARLDHIDVARLRDLPGIEVVAATDVDNPLLGPRGAAAVYGPQKGASPDDVARLEEGLARWADVAEQSFGFAKRDEPGAGAAGGLGFAALGFLGATTRPGIELMLDLLAFADHLPGARLVVTGEGALDTQTLHGKAPAGVAGAVAASAPDLPVVAVAGVCSLTPGELRSAGIARAYALADIEPDLTRCLEQPGPLLEELAGHIARDWLASLRVALQRGRGRHQPCGGPCRGSPGRPTSGRAGSVPGTGEECVLAQGGGHGGVLVRQGAAAVRGGPAQPEGERGVGEYGADRLGEPWHVTGRDEQGGVLAGKVGRAAGPGGHDGHPRPQCLLQDERLALPRARQDEHRGGVQQGRHVIAMAREPRVESERGRAGLELGLERAFARDDQQRLGLKVAPPGRRVQQGAKPLLDRQPARREHQRAVRRRAAGQRPGGARGPDRRDGVRGNKRAADPASAGRAHAFFQVLRYAQHRVRTAGDDQLEHAVDRAGEAASGRRVVHGDDQGGLGVVDGRPDERQRDGGEGARAQAVRVHHVRPPGGDQATQPPDSPQVVTDPRAVRDLDRGEGDLAVR
jgi:glycerate kinase